MQYKLGKLPRSFNPRVPHFSANAAAITLPPPPPSVDYTQGVAKGYGFMMNDRLGDCTCAAFYHMRQIWSLTAGGTEHTDSDWKVLRLYEMACGYDPNNPATDQGGNMQTVCTFLLKHGAPTDTGRDKIIAFIEIDPRQQNDVKHAICDCGGCYIGVNLPSNILPQGGAPPAVWDVDGMSSILGGHAISLAGYNDQGPILISWGSRYQATWNFFHTYCEEAYAIADHEWIKSTGVTPLGLTIPQLQELMQAL